MNIELVTTAAVEVGLMILRLGIPVAGLWLFSKGLRLSLAILP